MKRLLFCAVGILVAVGALAQEIDVQTDNLIRQSHRKYLDYSDPDAVPECLTLAVITDLHGDAENLQRFLSTCDKYKDVIDSKIELGDIVPNWFGQDFEFYKNMPGTADMLMVIGNHDTRPAPSGGDWCHHAGKDAYGKYFKPFSEAWLAGVVQAGDGACYYYRDFPAQRIRLIVLDSMSWCDKQTAWLTGVLSDARVKGLSVVCADHLPVGEVTPISSFNSLDYGSYAGGYSGSPKPVLDAVTAFMEEGGEFITWMSGDSHFDFTGILKGYPGQFSITFENGGCMHEWNDSERTRGTLSQDSFNFVTIDTYSKLIKVVRIGNDHDRYLRSKKYFCYNYSSGELVAEF